MKICMIHLKIGRIELKIELEIGATQLKIYLRGNTDKILPSHKILNASFTFNQVGICSLIYYFHHQENIWTYV